MRFDWLNALRSSWKSVGKRRHAQKAPRWSETHLPTTIEQLEPLLLLTLDVYIYSGTSLEIMEGDTLNVWCMSAGMSTGTGTLNYRIENTDRGLDGTNYANGYDGTTTFSGPMQGFQLIIPTFDNTLDELPRHFRVSFAPGDGLDSVSVQSIDITVMDNDFDSANAYCIVDVTVDETDSDFILNLGNPSGGNNPVSYYGTDFNTEPQDWSYASGWGSSSQNGPTSVAVTITGDLIAEYSETFNVFAQAYLPLSSNGWYGWYDSYAPWTVQYRVTIIDNDPNPKVYLDPNNPPTVDASNPAFNIWQGNVIIDGPTEKNVSVTFSMSDGTSHLPRIHRERITRLY